MTAKGMKEHGTARWCCGDQVIVKAGKDYEPDDDTCAEEFPSALKDLQNRGLSVFPAVQGKFAPIDGDLGLAVTITLMERDFEVTITPENEADAVKTALELGVTTIGTVAGCAGSGGFGCLLSIGGVMKQVIEKLFDLSQTPAPITGKDPDDYMGTNIWTITRYEARVKTSTNGTYAFQLPEIPVPYMKSCLGWTPCPAGAGVPVTMRVRPYFCLVREGLPENDIKKLCTPYTSVLPWPMQ
jgi:hypothetical protein